MPPSSFPFSFKLPTKHAEHEDEITTVTNIIPSSAASTLTSQNYTPSGHNNLVSQQDYEAEEEVGLELPPPMKPMQEPCLMANGPPAFNKDMKENSVNMVSNIIPQHNNIAKYSKLNSYTNMMHSISVKFQMLNFSNSKWIQETFFNEIREIIFLNTNMPKDIS